MPPTSTISPSTSQELLNLAVTNAPIVITVVDCEGIITFSEGNGLARLGRAPGSTVGRSAFDLFVGMPKVLDCLHRVLQGERCSCIVDLGHVVFDAHYTPLYESDGSIRGAIAVSTDITERARQEEEARASEERLQAVISSAPLIFFALDHDGRVTMSRGRGLDLLGLESNYSVGHSIFDLHQDNAPVVEHARRALAGEVVSFAVEIGGLVFDARFAPIRDSDGRVVGVTGVALDSTERVEAERARRQSEERFRVAFTGASVGITLMEPDGRFVEVNRAFAALTGYTEDELLGMDVLTLTPLEDRPRMAAFIQALQKGELERGGFENLMVCKDDRRLWVQVHSTLVRDDQGNPLHLVSQIQDVSARKAAEQAVYEESARLAAVIEAQHAIAMAGLDLETVMRLIVRYTQSLTNATGSVIEIIDGDEMVYRACEGALAGTEGTRLKQDTSLSGLCARTGEVILANDCLHDPRANIAACRRLHIGSMLLVPLAYEQKKIGVLKVTHHATGAFAERDVATLHLMTGLLSSAMSTCDAFAAEQQAIEALMMSEERFRGMLEMAPVGACIIDDLGVFEAANAAICELYGYGREELLGHPYSMLLPGPDAEEAMKASLGQVLAGEQRRGEGTVVARGGHQLTVLTNSVAFIGEDGRLRQALFVFDITERKQFEEHITHVAHHDALTGLPNRILYHDRLEQALLTARRQSHALSILVIDLNGFKLVNDRMGHDAGDALLREVAARLLAVVRSGDTVARPGGDEFAMVLPQADEAGAIRVANKIRAALEPAITIEGREARVGASVGIAVLAEHGDSADALIRAADQAMYVAKAAGGGYAVYRVEQAGERPGQGERRPPSLAVELRQAIAHGDLRLHYQPLVSCSDGRVRRVEALVRWEHPERGLLPPDHFVSAAEQSGAITPLTIWVLEEALRQCRVWHDQGLELGVAVNVSLRTLCEAQFPDLVAALLRQYAITPGDLTLEITERSVLEEQELTLEVLRALAALGVRIALDDVGVGHSSLGYITQLPVHELKVDRSFLSEMPGSKGHAVVCCILGLGTALDLSVVVEGVETQETWDWLTGLGCDWAQGYFMSRPLPPRALEQWYREHPAPEPVAGYSFTNPA